MGDDQVARPRKCQLWEECGIAADTLEEWSGPSPRKGKPEGQTRLELW